MTEGSISCGIHNESIYDIYHKYTRKKILFIAGLILLIIVLIGVAASIGSANLPLYDVYAALISRFFSFGPESTWTADVVLWKLRFPRIFMAIFAGMALGITGVVMQSVLKNPLADPYMMGIQSAAGFGASLAIIFGTGFLSGGYLIAGNAFLFSLIAVGIIILLSDMKDASAETMILTGIAVMFFFSAMTTFIQYFAEAEAVKSAMFWAVGDLGKTSWDDFYIVIPLLVCCFLFLLWKTWDMNILAAGDETAKSLGIPVRRVRITIMIVSSLLVSGVVCFIGAIGFVGLVSPHICRLIIGGDNQYLLPASGLVGAVLLIVSDTVARTIMSPAIIPVGVITAFIGVPFFIYLIMFRKGEFW
ncbi:FecCD family ABC transporter permease [Methanospirillum stamsii]|uniref:Cobalamin import system permease protein BtuC n=1 Tax=Methanospirillum stamsii TaxID=1277351 RepID=A0A2V2NK30_9EURY|nr:iron ABC transporter permease [Methanospirillum stamsii]PWR75971.1 iron ABC transporter permease [Methanospirillum stamsii]